MYDAPTTARKRLNRKHDFMFHSVKSTLAKLEIGA